MSNLNNLLIQYNLILKAPLDKDPDKEYDKHLWKVGAIINYDWGFDDEVTGETPEQAVLNWCNKYATTNS